MPIERARDIFTVQGTKAKDDEKGFLILSYNRLQVAKRTCQFSKGDNYLLSPYMFAVVDCWKIYLF